MTVDTVPEPAFDDLAWLARLVCQTPIAQVSLVGMARDVAFRARELGIRFYACAPLVGRDGHRYGRLCVADTQPRRLTDVQRDGLVRLARQASDALETRRLRRAADARESTRAQLLDAMPDCVVTCDADGKLTEFNGTARAWHGVDLRTMPPEAWAAHFHLQGADGRTLPIGESSVARALRGEHVREAELVICAAGRPPRIVRSSAGPLNGADGARLGAVSIMHDVTSLRAAEASARVEAQRFADAFSSAAQGMALVSLEGCWLEVNDALCEMFGYSREDLASLDFQRLTHPDDLQSDLELLHEVLAGKRQHYQMDKRYFHRTGRVIHAHLSVSLVRDAQGRPLHFVSQVQDFTSRVRAEEALRATANHLRTVTDTIPGLIAHVGADLRYQFVNRAYAAWFGREPDALVGEHMADVMRPEHFQSLEPKLRQALAGQPVSFDADVPSLEGDVRHMHATYVPDPRPEGAETTSFHLMIHDQTAQVRLARMLAERALRDELTGLPNRAAWNEELTRAVARAQRAGTPLAVMFLDLDGFKQINDVHGHAAGDHVLQELAAVLRSTLRAGDVVARLGGDEFVVLLDHLTDLDGDPRKVAAKLRERLAGGTHFRGRALQIRPSIGIGIQRGPHYDAETMMRCADDAMYAAKRAGDQVPQVRECGGSRAEAAAGS